MKFRKLERMGSAHTFTNIKKKKRKKHSQTEPNIWIHGIRIYHLDIIHDNPMYEQNAPRWYRTIDTGE